MNWQWGVCHFIHHRVEIFYPFISCNGKCRGLVLTNKSCVSLSPPTNLLLVCTCEMMGSSVWLRTQIYGIISRIMDIEDISYYSFTVRNMTCINSNLCACDVGVHMCEEPACRRLHIHVCVWWEVLCYCELCETGWCASEGFFTSSVFSRSPLNRWIHPV